MPGPAMFFIGVLLSGSLYRLIFWLLQQLIPNDWFEGVMHF